MLFDIALIVLMIDPQQPKALGSDNILKHYDKVLHVGDTVIIFVLARGWIFL